MIDTILGALTVIVVIALAAIFGAGIAVLWAADMSSAMRVLVLALWIGVWSTIALLAVADFRRFERR